MTVMLLGLPPEVGIVVVLLLFVLVFGGSRLAGLGKNAGTAIREFKEETDGLRKEKAEQPVQQPPMIQQAPVQPTQVQQPYQPVQQAQPYQQAPVQQYAPQQPVQPQYAPQQPVQPDQTLPPQA